MTSSKGGVILIMSQRVELMWQSYRRSGGVEILKLSVLLYSNTAIFHVQVEVHVEISFNFQLMA